jgi:hypothetical protein
MTYFFNQGHLEICTKILILEIKTDFVFGLYVIGTFLEIFTDFFAELLYTINV